MRFIEYNTFDEKESIMVSRLSEPSMAVLLMMQSYNVGSSLQYARVTTV